MKTNVFLRFSATVLAIWMVLSLVACSDPAQDSKETNGGEQTDGQTEEATEFVPDIEVKNYEDEFVVVNGGSFTSEFHFVEDYSGDIMNDAVYERMVKVKDHIGVECVLTDAGSWTEYAGTVMRSVSAGGDDYQLVMTHVYQGITQLMTGDSLYDFRDFDTVNLDAPYWKDDLMADLSVNGRYLFGYNDFCLASVNVITFNKALAEDNHVDSPYDLVRNNKWTLDKMMELAAKVSVNLGDSSWGTEDIYGLTNTQWATMISMTAACDIQIVNCNQDGGWYVAYNEKAERMTELLEKIVAMYKADWSYLATNTHSGGDEVHLSAGRTLFYMEGMAELYRMKGEDIAYGILPYPMFDEEQGGYRSLSWNGLLCVPTTIKNPTMVGEVLELLSYYSDPVKAAFYENLFGSKLAQDPDDAEMLEILWNSQVSERAFVVANTTTSMDQLLYMLPLLGQQGQTSTASFMKIHEQRAQRGIDSLIDKMK